MKIIGHRGASKLALENSIASINKAVASGVDYIELDIRKTRDNKLVLNHDANLARTYGVNLSIKNHKLKDIHELCPNLPTLQQALKACKNKGVILELKEHINPNLIFNITNKFTHLDIRFASFNHSAIKDLKNYNPNCFCYVLEHHSPFEIINTANKIKANGVGLNYGVINPLTYLLAKRHNLSIYVYTLNNTFIGRVFKFLYKDVDICTDNPKLFKFLKKSAK
jgi:glycerophosphoryl diester phosphodiesterase